MGSKRISALAVEAVSTLLPTKSRDKYEKMYSIFNSWRTGNNVEKVDEEVMLAFFHEKAAKLKSSTLWSTYSMLKSTLRVKDNIDISKYGKLMLYLKRQNDGHEVKKSKVLSQDNVSKFLINAPNDTFLMIKVALIFGLYGACRSEEMRKLNIGDIEDAGTILIVTLNDTKTKKKRIFTVMTEISGINEIELYRRYVSLRPNHTNHTRFFVFYKNNKCSVQPVGIHSFYKMPSKIAQYLELSNPTSYTGHCLRRTSTTFLANGGADIRRLKEHGGWRTDTVAEEYVEESINNKMKTSQMIFNQQPSLGENLDGSDVPNESHSVSVSNDLSKYSLNHCKNVTFTNVNNCIFNVYSNK